MTDRIADPTRRNDVDIARAIAAFAVVVHHIPHYFKAYHVGDFATAGGIYFADTVMTFVNFMHITTFMLMAGIMMALTGREIGSLKEYGTFVRTKFCRLMLPFVAISCVHLAVKMAAPGRSTSELPHAVLNSAVAPMSGLAGHLWFLYCLMTIFVLWPLVSRLGKAVTMPVLAGVLLIVAVCPIPWPPSPAGDPRRLLGLRELAWFLPIFLLGFWYGGRKPPQPRPRAGGILVTGALFIGSFLAFWLPAWPKEWPWTTLQEAVRMVGNVSAAFFLLWVAGAIAAAGAGARLLTWLGKRSYDVYLLHVALVGYPLAFVLGKLHLATVPTYVAFVAVCFVTYAVPIGIGAVIRAIPPLAFVMLGLPARKKPAAVPQAVGAPQP